MNNNKNSALETEEQAIQSLSMYTGNYYNLAISQFKLSRQQKKSIADSLSDVYETIIQTSTDVIERR